MTARTIAPLSKYAKTIGLTVALAVSFVALGSGFVEASSNAHGFHNEAEIAKLTYCYARGTDAIGAGDVTGGKAIYADCFAPNAYLAVWFPGTPFEGPPSFETTGTNAWADFVDSAFVDYTATQHLISNVDVDIHGKEATMTSYLIATHVRADGTVDIANGTYVDELERIKGKWVITSRTLKLISFVNAGNP
jgi:hypothetical protein